MIGSDELKLLEGLRHELHRHPELSGEEKGTAERIAAFLKEHAAPDHLIEGLGGHGLLAVYEGKAEGESLLFRCELDALPIQEKGGHDHLSENKGVSHKCGHDGHMAIIAGLGMAMARQCPERGKVLLLFQPAEETGEGAARVLGDPKFQDFRPDKVYAIHNLPGFPEGRIVTKPETFASASKGKEVFLYGRTAHAGEPQNGISPALAMADIVKKYFFLPQQESFEDFVLVTVIHARLGSIAFGTSPGEAEVRATLRSYREDDMAFLDEKAEEIAVKEARENELAVSFDEKEVFPASWNDPKIIEQVERTAKELGLDQERIREPFKWSEDFGHFLQRWPGALFGLGSGSEQPDLHNDDYDFPDAIVEPAVRLFDALARKG